LKKDFSQCNTTDEAIHRSIKETITTIPNSLKEAHNSMIINLNDVFDGNEYETKFKDYEYFKDICFQVKADFKSTYKFKVIQEETDTKYLEVRIDIHTILKNYTFILSEKTQIDDNEYGSRICFNIGEDATLYFLHKPNVTEQYDFTAYDSDKIYNFKKMTNQILSTTKKENKEYKLDLKDNKKYFLSSKKTVEQLEVENITSLITELNNDFIAVSSHQGDTKYALVNSELKVIRKIQKNKHQAIKLIIEKGLLPIPHINQRYLSQYVFNKRYLKNVYEYLQDKILISDTNYQKRQLEYFKDIRLHTEEPSQEVLNLIEELEKIIPMMENELNNKKVA
jgi:hypothetical protein